MIKALQRLRQLILASFEVGPVVAVDELRRSTRYSKVLVGTDERIRIQGVRHLQMNSSGGEAGKQTSPSLDGTTEQLNFDWTKVINSGAGKRWLEHLKTGGRQRGHKLRRGLSSKTLTKCAAVHYTTDETAWRRNPVFTLHLRQCPPRRRMTLVLDVNGSYDTLPNHSLRRQHNRMTYIKWNGSVDNAPSNT